MPELWRLDEELVVLRWAIPRPTTVHLHVALDTSDSVEDHRVDGALQGLLAGLRPRDLVTAWVLGETRPIASEPRRPDERLAADLRKLAHPNAQGTWLRETAAAMRANAAARPNGEHAVLVVLGDGEFFDAPGLPDSPLPIHLVQVQGVPTQPHGLRRLGTRSEALRAITRLPEVRGELRTSGQVTGIDLHGALLPGGPRMGPDGVLRAAVRGGEVVLELVTKRAREQVQPRQRGLDAAPPEMQAAIEALRCPPVAWDRERILGLARGESVACGGCGERVAAASLRRSLACSRCRCIVVLSPAVRRREAPWAGLWQASLRAGGLGDLEPCDERPPLNALQLEEGRIVLNLDAR